MTKDEEVSTRDLQYNFLYMAFNFNLVQDVIEGKKTDDELIKREPYQDDFTKRSIQEEIKPPFFQSSSQHM